MLPITPRGQARLASVETNTSVCVCVCVRACVRACMRMCICAVCVFVCVPAVLFHSFVFHFRFVIVICDLAEIVTGILKLMRFFFFFFFSIFFNLCCFSPLPLATADQNNEAMARREFIRHKRREKRRRRRERRLAAETSPVTPTPPPQPGPTGVFQFGDSSAQYQQRSMKVR